MTNEEKIREIFPKTIFIYRKEDDKTVAIQCSDEWLNAEYKEPTTKNDLGVENDLVSSIVEKISEQVTETHEEFIFETIRPYCENVMQMKISKRDLEQALLKYYGKNDLAVDCISRADAIRVASGYCHPSNVAKELAKLPSVTPQPRKGHWIPTYGNVKCSLCGSVKDSREVGKATHYCDFCGAKMEGEEV